VTKRTARNLFLLALALVTLLALVMQGCATEYTWKRTHVSCADYTWTVIPYAQLHSTCGQTRANHPNLGACAYMAPTCVVYSHLSESAAARTMSGDGEDLRTHELRHILNGETH
jgi:hypothetical protein